MAADRGDRTMEETKKLRSILIRSKWVYSVIGVITSVLASVVLLAVATVVVVVTSAGSILAPIRRESRREKTPPDWYAIPGRSVSKDARVIE
jgi:hypothetical protein